MFCGDRSLRSSHGPQRVTPPAERRIIAPEPHRPGQPWRDLGVVGRRAPPTPTCWRVPPRARTSTVRYCWPNPRRAGRGRHGRSWSTPPRSQIALSVGVGVGAVPNEAWGWLPLLTGVAVVDALGEVTGLAADLKWPNNVLLGDGKGRHSRRSGRTPTGGRGGCGPERHDDCRGAPETVATSLSMVHAAATAPSWPKRCCSTWRAEWTAGGPRGAPTLSLAPTTASLSSALASECGPAAQRPRGGGRRRRR